MGVSDFELPERFVCGSVGPAGQRTFFLQARIGPRLMSVSMEKEQLVALAAKVKELLATVGQSPDGLEALIDNATLEAPIEEEFRVVAIGLAWDPALGQVVIEAHDRDPDEESPVIESLRVRLSPPAAAEFARRSEQLVASGRPVCPLCGQPLDPSGHLCPRANGYRR